MAVTESKLIETRSDYGIDDKNSHQKIYLVKTDANAESSEIIAGAQSSTPHAVPKLNDIHEDDSDTFCSTITVQQPERDNYRFWSVTAEYTAIPTYLTVLGPVDLDPVLREPRIRLEWERQSRTVYRDVNNNRIVNYVGDAFEEGFPQQPVSMPVIMIDKAYRTLEEIMNIGLQYDQAVNSSTFLGREQHTVLFDGITTSDLRSTNGFLYYMATFRFLVNPELDEDGSRLGWRVTYPQRGWRVDDGNGNIVQATDADQLPVNHPVHLEEDGTERAPTLPLLFSNFEISQSLDFNIFLQ